jgi:hypothetical protein
MNQMMLQAKANIDQITMACSGYLVQHQDVSRARGLLGYSRL